MRSRRRTQLAVAALVLVAIFSAVRVLQPMTRAMRGGVPSSDQPAVSAPSASRTAVATATSTPTSTSTVDTSQLDPRVTQATVSQTIGISGWSKRVRPPVGVTEPIKLRLMREHGYTGSASNYELDHFIPLELGGSSNLSNLWLEPIAEARKKDQAENFAHREVVAGVWTLAQGQQYIRDHWQIYYRQ